MHFAGGKRFPLVTARRLEREVCRGDGEDGSVNDTVARANAPEVMFTAQSGGGAKEEEAARTFPITSKAATLHHGRQFLPLGTHILLNNRSGPVNARQAFQTN